MKKYTSRATKWLATFVLLCSILFSIGIALLFSKDPLVSISIPLISSGGLLGVLFLCCFLAENSRTLIIDADKIIFPRGADKNGKIVFQKTVVKRSEIRSVESAFHKGDKIISGDCFFHTLKLKDGTKITVTLYAYGKEAEKEIIEIIRKGIS